ncbi:MAG TPA: hypothetical protein VM889_09515 [Candidatus Thermoplasmatota archaeon]|nr:hypothetical protein [Candidatus Thermoplasmatota archaeon]
MKPGRGHCATGGLTLRAIRVLVALAIVLASAAIAGCLGAKVPPPEDIVPTVDPVVPDLKAVFAMDHDHTDPAAHPAPWNFHAVAHLAPAIPEVDWVTHNELDLAGDLLYAGIRTGMADGRRGPSGFAVYDVSNASAPVFLHFEKSPADADCVGDVKAGPGEGLVVLATQCARNGPVGRGFVVYDVTTPTAPKVVALAPLGFSCHMVDVAVVGGERYVYCADTSGPSAWRLVSTPLGLTPVMINTNLIQEPLAARNAPRAVAEFGVFGTLLLQGPHDMTTQADPLTGDPVVVVSHSYAGVRILDGKDPTLGRVLGAWNGDGAKDFSWIHTAAAAKIQDKRIVVAVTENVVDTPPRLWILDFTDYAKPKVLSEYALAGHDNSHALVFSLHNFQIVGERLYIAAYHGGVWALDLADLANPEPLGYILPHGEHGYKPDQGTFYGIGNDWTTQVWDVVLKDGYVIASDMLSGLHVLHFALDAKGDPALRSFG